MKEKSTMESKIAGFLCKGPLLFFFLTFVSAQENPLKKELISSSCKNKLHNRKEVLSLYQKNKHLILRHTKMTKLVPVQHFSLHRKLYRIKNQLSLQLTILENKISYLEEELIRMGCPGLITLKGTFH